MQGSRRVLPAGNASENTKPAAGSFCFCRNCPPEFHLFLSIGVHPRDSLSSSLCLLATLLLAQPVNSTKKKFEVDGGMWRIASFSACHLLARPHTKLILLSPAISRRWKEEIGKWDEDDDVFGCSRIVRRNGCVSWMKPNATAPRGTRTLGGNMCNIDTLPPSNKYLIQKWFQLMTF